ncbi:TetR/AcrR family transcriptional regulator [Sandarakinorhabdus cyanobacteriorum]|nr:TetR/AcrR family transcriptional regulator [Sandarakinorhabdus cyanobacteriorum]
MALIQAHEFASYTIGYSMVDISEQTLMYVDMKEAAKTTHIGRPVNEEARSLRRDQILAGARVCFLRKGFHAATTAEISAEAKVSVANLYQYFPTKDDLVRALIEEELAGDLELIRIVEEAPSFRQGLEITTRMVTANRDVAHDSRLRLEILAEAARNPTIAAVVKAADDHLVREIGAVIARYQAKGELRADFVPEVAARIIVSLFDGMTGRFAFGLSETEDLIVAADQFIVQALAPVAVPPI